MAILLFYFMLCSAGIQPFLAMASVEDGITDLVDILPVWNQSNDTLPLHDVRAQINSNAVALSNLNALLAQFLSYSAQNPKCTEETIGRQVAQAMQEGFSEIPRLFRQLLQSFNLLKLVGWRIDFVHSLGVSQALTEAPCPLPFFMREGKCIYIELKARRSFRFAKMACRAMGGSLIEPQDLESFGTFVEKVVQHNTKEVYVGGVEQETAGTWQWLSGGPIENIPWENSTEIDDDPSNCLSIKGYRYKDISCDKLIYFACERPI